MMVRNAQEQTLVVLDQIPYLQVAGRRDETAVVVIRRISEGVVIDIHLAAGSEQFDLIVVAALLEYAYRLVSLHFEAVEYHILCYDFLHTLFYRGDVFFADFDAVLFAQIAVEATRNRMFHI